MSEELIARKLVADGDGTNEDRRIITTLYTLYDQLEREPTNTGMMARIDLQLQQAQLAFDKQLVVAEVCVTEANQVQAFIQQTETSIEKLRSRIEAVKEELGAAKVVRKNRQSYDAMAKQIHERPSRQETQAALEDFERELAELLERQKGLENQLAEKKKRLYDLAVLLNQLIE